jgi:four helix bundle protein
MNENFEGRGSFAKRFEELRIWQEARGLVRDVYGVLSHCSDFSFRDQIQRAALSVMNNIAEGFERRTKKDFAHFLDVAKGSAGEVRSMTYAAEDLSYLSNAVAASLRERCVALAQGIAALSMRLRD